MILATTRRYQSVLPFYQELGLHSPFICGNGAQVWQSASGPLWSEHTIPEGAARTIACLADERGWELGITYPQVTYLRQRPGQSVGQLTPELSIVAKNADGVAGAPLRILAWSSEAIQALADLCRSTLAQHCSTELYVDAQEQPHSLGIFAVQANKGMALRLVMERLGVTRQQVVTMGDNYNDLSMFACGDIAVAMANAPLAVRQRASLVAPSHDEEGVAWALKHLQVV